MTDKNYTDAFNLILCRYNEIGLKSQKVRTRMEYRLIDHIKLICKREKLQLLSVLRLGGRLIFFFPNAQINRAITVFQYIIGLQSISPGFSLERNYETIQKTVQNFAGTYFENGDSFAIRAKRLKPFPIDSQVLEKELGSLCLDFLKDQGKKVRVDLTNPKKVLFLEVREKGAYIYTEKIPTIWGGNPIEYDKGMLCVFTGRPEDYVAAQLLIRRGTVIIPMNLDLGKYASKFENSDRFSGLERIAIFYPESLKYLNINLELIIDTILNKMNSENALKSRDPLLIYLVSLNLLFESLIYYLNDNKLISYTDKKVWIKGIISSIISSENIIQRISQIFMNVFFTPLAGLSKTVCRDLYERFMNPIQVIDLKEKRDWNNEQEFSLADVINRDITRSSKSDLDKPLEEFHPLIPAIWKSNYEFIRKKAFSVDLKEIITLIKSTDIDLLIRNTIKQSEIRIINTKIFPD